jgi:hypothetical protein
MKQAKAFGFILGILAVLALAGCSNPAVEPPFSDEALGTGPDAITLHLSGEGEDGSRSAAGLDAARIMYSSTLNFIQIVVQDAQSGAIAAVAEVRKAKTTDTQGTLSIKGLTRGKTYNILLLHGHWNYTGVNGNNEYQYDDGTPPTLLGTGFSSNNTIPQTGPLSVSIDRDPLWIDTKFTTDTSGVPGALASVEPDIGTSGTTKTVGTTGLVPVSNWKAAFTVYRQEGNSTLVTGFRDLLDAETANSSVSELTLQETSPVLWIKEPGGSTPSQISSPGTLSRGSGTDNHIFTYTIPQTYTDGFGRLGTEGYVNFTLKYIPLNKTAAIDWSSAAGENLSQFFTGVPEWIIRNGVNDNPQNARTNFLDPSLPSGDPDSGLNWNGAAPFTVALVRSTPPAGSTYTDPTPGNNHLSGYDPDWRDPYFPNYTPPEIILTAGAWGTVSGSGSIQFYTQGTFTGADWYYTTRQTGSGSAAPANSVILANPGSDTIDGPSPGLLTKSVTIPGYVSGTNYHAWVIAVKDYTMSQPIFIAGDTAGFNFGFRW